MKRKKPKVRHVDEFERWLENRIEYAWTLGNSYIYGSEMRERLSAVEREATIYLNVYREFLRRK